MRGPANDQYTLTVQNDGTFVAAPSPGPGCAFSGSFTPRASGKNVFNATITNGAAPCLDAGLISNGIAFVSPAGAQVQLTLVTLSADRQKGAVVSGLR